MIPFAIYDYLSIAILLPASYTDDMKLFRYRRPSINTMLGVTKYKRRLKRSLGISQVEAWTKPSRIKQRVKGRLGLYSVPVRIVRNTTQGKLPSLLGIFTKRGK